MYFPAGVELERKLRAIAQEFGVSPQVLLRRAAEAVVRCAEEYGTVPLDMRIVQASHPSRLREPAPPMISRLEPQLNEAPAPYEGRAETGAATSPKEPPAARKERR